MKNDQSRTGHFTWLLIGATLIALPLASPFVLDKQTSGLLQNTLWLAGWTSAISLPLGIALAILLVRTNLPGRQFAMFAIAAMLFVPLYFQAAGWEAGFGRLGWYLDPETGLKRPWLDGWRGAIWVHAMAATPWVALIVGMGLRLVEPELEEEALLDGSELQVIFRVILPRSAGSVVVAMLWVMLMTAGEMTVTNLKKIRTFAEEIYLFQSENIAATVPATVSTVLVICWLVLAAFAVTSCLAPRQALETLRPARQINLGRVRPIAVGFLVLIMLLIVVMPLINLCSKAGIDVQEIDGDRVRIWSVKKFVQVVGQTPVEFRSEFFWTLVIGATSASSAVIIGLATGWAARRGGWDGIPAMIFVVIGLAIPGPLIAVAIISVVRSGNFPWLAHAYTNSIFAPWLATMIRALPLVIFILWYSLRSVGDDQLDSSATEGAGAVARFCHIAIRGRWPSIVAAWIVGFALASGDLTASILVIPPGVDTVPRLVFAKIHSGVDDQAAGICLVFALGIVMIAAITYLLFRVQSKWGIRQKIEK